MINTDENDDDDDNHRDHPDQHNHEITTTDTTTPLSILLSNNNNSNCKVQTLTISDQHATLLLTHQNRHNEGNNGNYSFDDDFSNENERSADKHEVVQHSLLNITLVPFHKTMLEGNPIFLPSSFSSSAPDNDLLSSSSLSLEKNKSVPGGENNNPVASTTILNFLKDYKYKLKSESGAEYSYYSAIPSYEETKVTATATNDDDGVSKATISSPLLTPPLYGGLDIELISPASDQQISRAMPSSRHGSSILINETPDIYTKVIHPYITSIIQSGSLGWIKNVIERKKETERLLVNTSQFIINIDTKWRSHPPPLTTPRNEWFQHPSIEDLYCLGIVKIKSLSGSSISSIRDLTGEHIDLLTNIQNEGLKAIQTIYGLESSNQVRCYVHYPPQFYHFHVHFTRLENEVGCSVDRGAHLVSDIIQNLQMDSLYYQKRILTYQLKKQSPLHNSIIQYRQKDVVNTNTDFDGEQNIVKATHQVNKAATLLEDEEATVITTSEEVTIRDNNSSNNNSNNDDDDNNNNADIVVDIVIPDDNNHNQQEDTTVNDNNSNVTDSNNNYSRHVITTEPKPLKDYSTNDHSTHEMIFVVGMGLWMSFVAGYSNGVCLSGNILIGVNSVSSSVTGVTGLYTDSAISLLSDDDTSDNDYENENDLIEQPYAFDVWIIICVLAGACISSLMNPHPVAFELSPRYGPTFLVAFLFTAVGAYMGCKSFRAEFYFTAIGNGIMNGISSMYSANLLRTTHLTGTTTDIGLFIGQIVRGNCTNVWKLYILGGLAFSFWCGSLLGYYASSMFGRYSLVMNACFFFLVGIAIILYFIKEHNFTVWEAFTTGAGTYFEKEQEEKETVKIIHDIDNNDDSNSNSNSKSFEWKKSNKNDHSSITAEMIAGVFSPSTTTTIEGEKFMKIFDQLAIKNNRPHNVMHDDNEAVVNNNQLLELIDINNRLLVVLHTVFNEHNNHKTNIGCTNSNNDINNNNNDDEENNKEKDNNNNWTIHRDEWERIVNKEYSSSSPTRLVTFSKTKKRRTSIKDKILEFGSCHGAKESMDMMRIISIQELESHGYKIKEQQHQQTRTSS